MNHLTSNLVNPYANAQELIQEAKDLVNIASYESSINAKNFMSSIESPSMIRLKSPDNN